METQKDKQHIRKKISDIAVQLESEKDRIKHFNELFLKLEKKFLKKVKNDERR